MTLVQQLLLSFVITGFLYSLKYKVIRKMLMLSAISSVAIIFGILLFFAFEIGMFYNLGHTLSGESRYFINLFFDFEDVYKPIARIGLTENKNEYEIIATHKYEGTYCVWICDSLDADESEDFGDAVSMSLRIRKKDTNEEIHSSLVKVSETRQVDHISYQGMYYEVPDTCPLREEVKILIKVDNLKKLLMKHPNAHLLLRYSFSK